MKSVTIQKSHCHHQLRRGAIVASDVSYFNCAVYIKYNGKLMRETSLFITFQFNYGQICFNRSNVKMAMSARDCLCISTSLYMMMDKYDI